ncbi:hypothetical protein JCGZ_20552 [Jatropha curcas]|uniref:Uncharacterized protein n=1 Tax=Jatropha curcas TaxID=180498 RepID=A0A067JN29_JATCU|nr:hypothetical protein JCGZ_20552 [Jatropha curcas]
MRGIAALLPVKYKLKQVFPASGSWGTVATSTPKKQENHDFAEERRLFGEKADPIVAFSRPPPLPPVFGPLVALSLFQMLPNHDDGDDN